MQTALHHRWILENTNSGQCLGVYSGASESEARQAMLADAGTTEDAAPALKATPLADALRWAAERAAGNLTDYYIACEDMGVDEVTADDFLADYLGDA